MLGLIRNHKKLVVALLLAALVCVLVLPTIALARAGGGHSSNSGRSSSGGSSGRSSSGGSSGGSAGSFLGGAAVGSMLGGSHNGTGTSSSGSFGGCFGFIVLVIVIVVIYLVVRRAMGKNGMTPEDLAAQAAAMAAMQNQATAPANFDTLKAEDPNFSEQAFYGRVNEMFIAIQESWEARNMEPARRFLSEQQFQVLAEGVAEYVKNGQINKLDSLHVDRIQPVSVSREGDSDYVKVMITASVIDYTVDERSGQLVNPGVLGDGTTVKTFDEYWMLQRKVGAQTKSDASIRKCPNCGGPVTDGNYVKCAYCGTMMNDPALDWVLLRIEQP
jgi:predicted lipid-binding transport protein (Tim44 family)